MSSAYTPTTGRQNTPTEFFARAKLIDGSYVTQAALSSLRLTVTDENGTVTYTETGIDKTTTVFDTLQTWDTDGTGYNFAHECSGAAFPSADMTYRVCYFASPTGGEEFPIALFLHTTESVPGSVTPS